MHAEPISFMVGTTNIYGGIFYQMYLLPHLTITPPPPTLKKLGTVELWQYRSWLMDQPKIFISICKSIL